MWTAILGLASWLLNKFFPSKSPEQTAYESGQAAGQTAQKESDDAQTLKDIQAAKTASDSVSNDAASILRDPANAGPAKH